MLHMDSSMRSLGLHTTTHSALGRPFKGPVNLHDRHAPCIQSLLSFTHHSPSDTVSSIWSMHEEASSSGMETSIEHLTTTRHLFLLVQCSAPFHYGGGQTLLSVRAVRPFTMEGGKPYYYVVRSLRFFIS